MGRGLEALLGQLPGWSSPVPVGPKPPVPGPVLGPASILPALAVPSLTPPAAPPSAALPSPVTTPTASPAMPLAASPTVSPAVAPAEPPGPPQGPMMVAIELIEHNPHQPRQDFDPDEIQRLADSLASHGLLQAVVVRRYEDRYQLIAGERRLRAARQAGWTDVPVHVVEADDRQVAELAIVENLQRKDLNPLEKAACFQRYLQQYHCTQEELAGRLKLDRSTIANLIRLLELPEAVQDALRRGKITQGHARALLPLGDEREQIAFCERIQREGMNVRQTEDTVQDTIRAADREPLSIVSRDGASIRPRRGKSEHVAALEQEFRLALGLRVKITHGKGGRGKLVIPFADHDEFQRLRQHICQTAPCEVKSQAG
ncbi:MAG: ParB/RepB/Spo0J family partition protein [Thermoguttaceae bacterium]